MKVILFKHRKILNPKKIYDCENCTFPMKQYSYLSIITKEHGLSHKNRDYLNMKVCSDCLEILSRKYSNFNISNRIDEFDEQLF
jgi:hypothetical protein